MCDLTGVFAATPHVARARVLNCHCGAPSPEADAGRWAVVHLPASERTADRLRWLAGLRLTSLLGRRRLRRAGAGTTSRLAVWPTLARAAVVYEPGTLAAKYAESRLIPGSSGVFKAVLAAVAGVDAAVGAVVSVGQRGSRGDRRAPGGPPDPDGSVAIVREVRRAFPRSLRDSSVSVVRIRTTHPVMLLFDGRTPHPSCVVQRDDESSALSRHDLLSRLRRHDPLLFAESLGVITDDAGATWRVSRGLAGWPWFALADQFGGEEGFAAVAARAIEALARFRAAVQSVPEGPTTVDVRAELAARLDELDAVAPGLAADIPSHRRAAWLRALGAIGEVESTAQHGDFCLNNLMIDDASVGVIDFEEFGDTSMPLHDEFSLASSLRDFSHQAGASAAFADVLRRCGALSPLWPDLGPDAREALLVHHLLWRIEHCAARPTRAEMGARLAGTLRAVLTGGVDAA